jgi:hypothetical protein
MLAVLEGGGGITREGDLERTLREDYEAWRPLRVEDEPLNSANDRLLTCAEAAAYEHYTELDTLREQERREVIVGFALRIHAIAKATRELQEYGERRRVGHLGDPARDVLAWELQQQGVSSVEIGCRLGIPQTDWDRRKKDNQSVN